MITIEERFSCCIVVDTQLLPNTFDVKVNLLPANSTQKNYTVALERINIIFRDVFEDSILIGPSSVSKFKNAMGLNGVIHTLPDEPYDHLLAIALHTKISALVQDVFTVERVSVTSTQGNGVTHTFEDIGDSGDTLRELMDNPDLKEYVDYWYSANVNYIRLHPNGIKYETQNWEKEGLVYEQKDSGAVKRFRPRLVSDNDKDDDS